LSGVLIPESNRRYTKKNKKQEKSHAQKNFLPSQSKEKIRGLDHFGIPNGSRKNSSRSEESETFQCALCSAVIVV